MSLSTSNIVKWMAAIGAGVGVVVPLLLRAVLPADEIDQDLRSYWRSLNEHEKLNLAENVKEFEGLSSQEQQRLRDLRVSLKENSKQGRPFMMAAIGFHAWLDRLPPQDARAIRETTDIGERLALIDQLRPQDGDPADPRVNPGDGFPRNRGMLIAALPDMMEAIRAATPLTDEERNFVARTTGMSQHMATLVLAHKHASRADADWAEKWPSRELARDIQRVLADRNLGHMRMGSPDDVRMRLAALLGGMVREADRDQQDRFKRGLLLRSRTLITPIDLDRTIKWTNDNRPPKLLRRPPNRFGR